MNHALDAALLIMFLIVGVWVALFGIAGAVLAGPAGLSRTAGLVVCGLTGPLGLGWLIWKGRSAADRQSPRTTERAQVDQVSAIEGQIPGL